MQAKLLHVLQDGEFSRLGARVNTKVDVRVVAATNIDMQKAIADKTFREDLYYRLNAFVIHVPALRERKEEIPYLLQELSRRLAASNRMEPISFSARLISAALAYNWPGNLRELKAVMAAAAAYRSSGGIALTDLPEPYRCTVPAVPMAALDRAERDVIVMGLRKARGNKVQAARELGLSRTTLYARIRQLRIASW